MATDTTEYLEKNSKVRLFYTTLKFYVNLLTDFFNLS